MTTHQSGDRKCLKRNVGRTPFSILHSPFSKRALPPPRFTIHHSLFTSSSGFSLTELLIVLVIIGVLVLLAMPKLMPVVTRAKTTEAKLMLKQVHMLQQTFKYEYDRFSTDLAEIGFEQSKLITEGGQARYQIEVVNADTKGFVAQAVAVSDFDDDGNLNVWEVDQTGAIKEKIPD